MKRTRIPTWTWDKIVIGGHIYTVVLCKSKDTAAILWSSEDIDFQLCLAGLDDPHDLLRDRGLSQDIAGQYILIALDREGLTLPNKWFRTVTVPYDALFDNVKYKVGRTPDQIIAHWIGRDEEECYERNRRLV